MIRAVRPVIVFGLSLGIFSAQAAAVPLAPEDCVRARSEQFILEGSGVPADMSRGAEWARANLEPERLKRIARWIELQEYILFRCPRPKPPPQPELQATRSPATRTIWQRAKRSLRSPKLPKSSRQPRNPRPAMVPHPQQRLPRPPRLRHRKSRDPKTPTARQCPIPGTNFSTLCPAALFPSRRTAPALCPETSGLMSQRC